MGFFGFFKKDVTVGLSDREKYGYAWLQIVGKKNRAKGLQIMKELNDSGFIEGTIALAMFTDNAAERKTLYKKAADQNHSEGLWGYSNFLQHSFVPDPKNPEDAEWEKYCLKAAQYGSADAMNELGNIFNRRNLFPQSMYWYAMANANDFPNGKASLYGIAQKWHAAGMPYEYEVTENFTEEKYKCALFYLEMWSEEELTFSIDEYIRISLAGEPLAAYLTGDVFEASDNMEMAYKMYNAMALENDAHGLKCYADMLFTGRGVEKDIQGALRIYQMSAERGDRAAMFVVGEFVKKQNKNMAAYWYGVAHTRGYQYALQRMTQLVEQ